MEQALVPKEGKLGVRKFQYTEALRERKKKDSSSTFSFSSRNVKAMKFRHCDNPSVIPTSWVDGNRGRRFDGACVSLGPFANLKVSYCNNKILLE